MMYYYLITTFLTLVNLIILICIYEPKRTNYYFMVLLILMALANGGYLSIALSQTVEEAILANKISYLGGCFMPTITLCLICRMCNFSLDSWKRILLYGYSFLVYAMVLTIGFNDWYYKETYLEKYEDITILGHTYGAGHAFFYVIMYGYLGVSVILLLYSYNKKHTVSRKNIMALLLMGISTTTLFLLGRAINPAIEIMPLVYVIDSWIFLYLYRRGAMYSLEDNVVTSIANQEKHGYIIFDMRLNFLGSNAVAQNIFPAIRECTVDRPLESTSELEVIEKWLAAYSSDSKEVFNLDYEARHYECRITEMIYQKKQCGYILELREDTDKWKYINLLASHNSELEHFQVQLESQVAEQTEELRNQQKKIREIYVQTVIALSDAVDAKDRYTSGHSKRVAEYSRMIAARMGKSKEEQEAIYRAGLLHDVGKIRIPAEIINKPGKLTDEEYNIIKVHPVTGYHILRNISDNSFIAVGAKYHHERYDGTGYPNGLAGEKIPEIARILGIADAYDAMASNRSYRNALPQESVRSEIEKGKGTQFDPDIADIMLQMIAEDKNYDMRQTDSMRRRILTIDDEAMSNKIIAHIMEDEPMYEVVSAGGGKEALALLDNEKFDLILLDMKMPDMDGVETLKAIRQKCLTPVVFMTSDKTLDTSVYLAELGCDDYITKPFLPLLLKEIVHNLTECTSIEAN